MLVTMIAYLLLRLTQEFSFTRLSMQSVCRRIGLNLMRRCDLIDLLSDPSDSINYGKST